jgi:Uma2 family endonuclease
MVSEKQLELPQTPVDVDWQPPMPPTDLIFDDGEPLETNRHRTAMNVLIRSWQHAASEQRNDFFVGGNMFIYYSSTQVKNRDFRGPDFFVVLNVDGSYPRQGWVAWEEGGRYPDMIVELLSASTAAVDKGIKKDLYESVFRTPDYFVFHPFDPNSLEGWHLSASQVYQPLEKDERGWLWCETLSLWLGLWEGTVEKETTFWLRFYDTEGNLVLLPEEAAEQKADAERLKADAAEQKADAERLKANTERLKADAERLKAEAAEQKAEAERQKADAAEQKADAAEQRAEVAEQLGALRQLLRLLSSRFGSLPEDVPTRLQRLNVNQLEDLVEVALAVDSREEFVARLD